MIRTDGQAEEMLTKMHLSQRRRDLKCISPAPSSGFRNGVGNAPLLTAETLVQVLRVGLKFLDFEWCLDLHQ